MCSYSGSDLVYLLNPRTLLSPLSRRLMIHPTPQSRGQSPAWSPSWCGGCLAGQSSCPLWPLDRQNSTTVIASRSQTQSQSHHGPQHCHYAPHHSSPSPPLTLAGRTMWTCVCLFINKMSFRVITVGGEWSGVVWWINTASV